MQFTADLTADTIALLEARARNGHDAGRIVNGLFVAIFTVLKHDKEFTLQHDRFDLLVADVARDAEQKLFAAIDRRHAGEMEVGRRHTGRRRQRSITAARLTALSEPSSQPRSPQRSCARRCNVAGLVRAFR